MVIKREEHEKFLSRIKPAKVPSSKEKPPTKEEIEKTPYGQPIGLEEKIIEKPQKIAPNTKEKSMPSMEKRSEPRIGPSTPKPQVNPELKPSDEEEEEEMFEEGESEKRQKPSKSSTARGAAKEAAKQAEKEAVNKAVAGTAAKAAGAATGPAGWATIAASFLSNFLKKKKMSDTWKNIILFIANIMLLFGVIAIFAILVVSCSGVCGKKTTQNPSLTSEEDMRKIKFLKAMEDIKLYGKKYILDEAKNIKDILEKEKADNKIPTEVASEADEMIKNLDIIINGSGNSESYAVKEALDKVYNLAKQFVEKLNDPKFGEIGPYTEPFNEYGYINPVVGGGSSGMYLTDVGLDINTPRGTYVMAIADGTIEYAKFDFRPKVDEKNFDLGKIGITLNDGRYAFYTHLSQIDLKLKTGDKVKKGQIIAKSGWARTDHLHIGIYDYYGGTNWPPQTVEALWFKK